MICSGSQDVGDRYVLLGFDMWDGYVLVGFDMWDRYVLEVRIYILEMVGIDMFWWGKKSHMFLKVEICKLGMASKAWLNPNKRGAVWPYGQTFALTP